MILVGKCRGIIHNSRTDPILKRSADKVVEFSAEYTVRRVAEVQEKAI